MGHLRREPFNSRSALRLRDGPTLPKLNDLNPFAEKAVPLPGKRIPVMQTQSSIVTGELADASAPIMLPAPFANEDWAQPGGSANNSPGHLAFSGSGQETWRADAGSGSSSAGRVTASPIVYANHVYALDAKGNVSAFSTSGSSLWRVSLRPGRENTSSSFLSAFSLGGGDNGSGGYGGGLAVDGGRLYAASGFGNVVALDPESGSKDLGEAARCSRALRSRCGWRQGVRGSARWQVLLPRRRRWRRAVVGTWLAAAGEPD